MRLSQEHKELQRTIERFVEKEINPHVATWEQEQMFPAHELFKKMGNLGLLGLTKPEEFGGMGLDYSYSVVAAQALGKFIVAAYPWQSAFKPTWPRPLWHGSAATNCAVNFWLLPLRATWWRVLACPNPALGPMLPV